MTARRTYCTILAANYLPKALVLAESLKRHEPQATLKVLFIDKESDDELEPLPGVEPLSMAVLGFTHHTLLDLMMAYELVEVATAVKPPLLRALLDDAEEVVYLDPDMYVTGPMAELGPSLAESPGGILLTPHFLTPTTAEAGYSEGHLLQVGVYNLGFCAVDRRALAFLDWWWDHLRHECLYDPLSALFVDQKWMDIGATLFDAGVLRHFGYNVGVANLYERPLGLDDQGYFIRSTNDRLRLFHFHAYDSENPERLSRKRRHAGEAEVPLDSVVVQLSKEYAGALSSFEHMVQAAPEWRYGTDQRGRTVWRQLRRVHREELRVPGVSPPSPFEPSEADAYGRWRRRAWPKVAQYVVKDAAKAARVVFPEEYDHLKARFPALGRHLKKTFTGGSGRWA